MKRLFVILLACFLLSACEYSRKPYVDQRDTTLLRSNNTRSKQDMYKMRQDTPTWNLYRLYQGKGN